jgi:hypothetical protein
MLLGQVLREVADVPPGLRGAAEDALGVHLDAEPHHVSRRLHLVERFFPGRQGCPRLRINEPRGPRVPHRQPITAVVDLLVRGPPDLVVGGFGDRRSSAREMLPRIAACQCGANLRWGSTVEKYWTSQPTQRRKFCTNRSSAPPLAVRVVDGSATTSIPARPASASLRWPAGRRYAPQLPHCAPVLTWNLTSHSHRAEG